MRRAGPGAGTGERESGKGLLGQFRHPPGGRDARIMLLALAIDRIGTGLWAASSVLYLTYVEHLAPGRIGVLLGAAGALGIAGSPAAGRLADRFPVRGLLIGCHLLRLVTLALVLSCHGFATLLPVIAVTASADRAAKTLEMVFATRTAGERRVIYQALSRSAANAGYGAGAGLAAIGLAVGTTDAYRVLLLGNSLSFAVAALLVWRTGEPAGAGSRSAGTAPHASSTTAVRPRTTSSPWRDPGYLRFVLLDIPMNLDDSVLGVGLPLWLVSRTSAPHALVPAFLVINTTLVVALQLSVSRRVEGPRQVTSAVLAGGLLMFVCCALLALAGSSGTWAAAVLLAVAAGVTLAELMRSVSSWELAVLLAPEDARATYLGVAGMSQSIQKSLGPPLLTGVVMAAGPAGWLVFGTAVAGVAVVQRRLCTRRLRLFATDGPTD
ncbi:MFS transporter [Streptomyces sp. NPDC096934]|uniref:MFS transporter n=1 Tax=Streptomyces sp. NPDC096934 TaxID=3155551 RepID=UPI00331B0FA7